jgi:hypothetical protein
MIESRKGLGPTDEAAARILGRSEVERDHTINAFAGYEAPSGGGRGLRRNFDARRCSLRQDPGPQRREIVRAIEHRPVNRRPNVPADVDVLAVRSHVGPALDDFEGLFRDALERHAINDMEA